MAPLAAHARTSGSLVVPTAYSEPIETLSGAEFVKLARSPFAHEELTGRGPIVLVDTDDIVADAAVLDTVRTLPVVLAGRQPSSVVDVAVDDDTLPAVTETVEQWPLASTSLALLLRGADGRSVADGLVAESAAYSMLQAGPEFARWREAHPPRTAKPEAAPAVRVERDGDVLFVTLSRPHVHNAYSAAMREELLAALAVAEADSAIKKIVLNGEGPSFCSGGDLDEFGTRPDPASAHLIRLTRSAARVMHALRHRIEVRLHGACMGAGIELPAFADHVVAARDTLISLPEVTLGLVPGAGGTVSIARRAGRHRACLLGLSGRSIDAATALSWGLVDAVEHA